MLFHIISRDHNATSYSTETSSHSAVPNEIKSRDHNATSYSTETFGYADCSFYGQAEIITLRAIALKQLVAILTAHKKAKQRS